MKELKNLKELVETIHGLYTSYEDINLLIEMGYEDEDPAMVKELEEEIHHAIRNLPEVCRKVFIKSRFEGKKYEEIATELNISVNTVKYHIKSALSSLHSELGKILIILILFFSTFK